VALVSQIVSLPLLLILTGITADLKMIDLQPLFSQGVTQLPKITLEHFLNLLGLGMQVGADTISFDHQLDPQGTELSRM
jgi:hypothetical protein